MPQPARSPAHSMRAYMLCTFFTRFLVPMILAMRNTESDCADTCSARRKDAPGNRSNVLCSIATMVARLTTIRNTSVVSLSATQQQQARDNVQPLTESPSSHRHAPRHFPQTCLPYAAHLQHCQTRPPGTCCRRTTTMCCASPFATAACIPHQHADTLIRVSTRPHAPPQMKSTTRTLAVQTALH